MIGWASNAISAETSRFRNLAARAAARLGSLGVTVTSLGRSRTSTRQHMAMYLDFDWPFDSSSWPSAGKGPTSTLRDWIWNARRPNRRLPSWVSGKGPSRITPCNSLVLIQGDTPLNFGCGVNAKDGLQKLCFPTAPSIDPHV